MPTKYYVFDDNKLKAEGMTKEQIINAIAEATGVTPQDVDEGFISTIVETNRSRSLHIWKGTQAEYNALETHDPATFYIIEDDTAIEDLQSDVENLQTVVSDVASDSGWINLYDTNDNNERVSYGEYRIIGKIVYYHLSYDYNEFQTHTFTLPVILSEGTRLDPVIDTKGNMYRAYRFELQGSQSLLITEVSHTNENGYIGFSFCGPIAE